MEGAILGRGGLPGVKMPSTVAAGEVMLHTKFGTEAGQAAAYANCSAGYGFTALKVGVYRVRYLMRVEAVYGTSTTYNAYAKLRLNGTSDVANSESVLNVGHDEQGNISEKSLDITLSAGDTVRIQQYATGYIRGYGAIKYFAVSILAPDLQEAFGEYITVV